GVVRQGEGGPGVPGATVHLLLSTLAAAEGVAAWPTAESDAQGVYRLEGVPPGRHALYVTHDTLVHTAVEASRAEPELPAEVIAFVPPGGAAIERDLVLEPGAVVRGVVVDEARAPVADATIVLVPTEGWGASQAWRWGVRVPLAWRSEVTTTDGDGAFQLVWMAGSAIRLGATCAQGVAPFSEPIPMVAGATVDDVKLVVASGVTVRGVVLAAGSRAPVAEARVRAWYGALPERPGGRVEAVSDAEGRFELRGLPRARMTLDASAPRGGGGARRALDLAAEGSDAEEIEVLLEAEHGMLLQLHDETGAPLAQQWVMVQGPPGSAQHVQTDHRGEVEIVGLRAGRYMLFLMPAGRPRVSLDPGVVVPTTRPVVRVVPRSAPRVVEGRVVLPDGSSPALCTLQLSAAPGSRSAAHGGPLLVSDGASPHVGRGRTAVRRAGHRRASTGRATRLSLRASSAPITQAEVDRGPVEIRA
ncbi:MAG: carboxypeptidase-like regulatory domain-containing protein, partial [Planctomycetota bacterium]